MREITLLVLAAGIGRRYRGLKQVEPVGPSGETILDYSLYNALQAGFGRLVFVIRGEIEQAFRQSVGRYWEKSAPVAYVYQDIEAGLPTGFNIPAHRQKPWGTGHAVLISRTTIDSPFAIINADDFYGPSGFRDLAAWLKEQPSLAAAYDDYCFVGYRLRNTLSEFGTVARGVCKVDERGFLAEVVERVKIEKDGDGARTLDENGRWLHLRGDEIVSMNFWGFTPTVFSHLDKGFAAFLARSGRDAEAEYFIPFAVNELLRSGKIRVKYIPTTEKWLGMTYPEDVLRVRSHIQGLIREGIYPENIRA